MKYWYRNVNTQLKENVRTVLVPNILGKLMTDPNKAGKAAQAFMQMRKLDIEKLVQDALA